MRVILSIALFIFCLNALALEVYLAKDDKDIPAEISLLLRSLPLDNLNDLDQRKVEGFTSNYSIYSNLLPKADLLFIVKVEVSKLLLSSKPDNSSIYKSYDIKRINEIEQRADWAAYSPWAQYIFRSFLKDAKLLVSDARFPSLWINSTSSTVAGLQIFRKRVELVLSWIDYFAFNSVISVNQKIEELALKNLGRIESASWILLSISYSKEVSSLKKTPNIFQLSKLKTGSGSQSAQQILNKLVDPILETSTSKLPEPVNDWVPREINTEPLKDKSIIKNKDPFYTAPVLLPKPTNDWILNL